MSNKNKTCTRCDYHDATTTIQVESSRGTFTVACCEKCEEFEGRQTFVDEQYEKLDKYRKGYWAHYFSPEGYIRNSY